MGPLDEGSVPYRPLWLVGVVDEIPHVVISRGGGVVAALGRGLTKRLSAVLVSRCLLRKRARNCNMSCPTGAYGLLLKISAWLDHDP